MKKSYLTAQIKTYCAIAIVFLLFACQKHSAPPVKPNVEVAAFMIEPVCNGVLLGANVYAVDSNFAFINQSYLKDTSDHSYVPVVAFHWDFGDGTASSEKDPTHKFVLPGIYTVTLVTYLNNHPSDTSSTSITVVMGLREYPMSSSPLPIDLEQAAQKGALALYSTLNSGGSSSTFSLLRVDSALNTRWSATIPGNSTTVRLSSIKQVNNSTYVLSGNYQSGNANEFCLTEIDSSGNLIWNKYIPNLPGNNTCTIPVSDGGLLTGGSATISGNSYAAVVKCDANGNEIWRRIFDSTNSLVNVNNLLETDSGYVFGSITTGYSFPNIVVTMLDFNGNIKKQTTITPGYPISFTSTAGVLYENNVFLVYATDPGADNYVYLFDNHLNYTGSQGFVTATVSCGFNDGNNFVLVYNTGQYATLGQVTTAGALGWQYTLDPVIFTSCTSSDDGAFRYCKKAILTSDNEIIALAFGENRSDLTQNVPVTYSLYLEKLTPDGKIK